jgi:tetratricopeptide (TPR) repeat protein
MAMTESEKFTATANALFSTYSNVQSQRSQMAQYAIQNAAKFMQENKNDEAIKEFKKALAFDSENSTALSYMGKLYLSDGKNSDAIKTFKDLVRLQPTSVDAHVNLGNAYLQDKQYVESEKIFKKAARLDPLTPLADYTLGIQYLQTDRLAEAKAQFLKVQKISPKDGNVYYSLGAVYNKEGNYEAAAINLEKALAFKKDFPAANYELGVAYNGLGMSAAAKNQLEILQDANAAQAEDLKFILDKPKMLFFDTEKNGSFVNLLGAGKPLWMIDPSLMTPDATVLASVTIQFNNEMDYSSIINPMNWSISRANSVEGGYYNNTMAVAEREVDILKNPLKVTYNTLDRTATLSFRVSQNAAGDATVDPSHLQFTFKGKDAAGREMDTAGDQIDGYSVKAF